MPSIGLGSNCIAAKCLYRRAFWYRHALPFHRKAKAKSSTASPIAPMVLKTLAIPTASIHGVIANTKTVLNVFLENVRATRASPMICPRVLG